MPHRFKVHQFKERMIKQAKQLKQGGLLLARGREILAKGREIIK